MIDLYTYRLSIFLPGHYNQFIMCVKYIFIVEGLSLIPRLLSKTKFKQFQ